MPGSGWFATSANLESATCKLIEDWKSEIDPLTRKISNSLVWPRMTELREFDYRQISVADSESDNKRLAWVRGSFPEPESETVMWQFFLRTLYLGGLLLLFALFIAVRWPLPRLGHLSDESSEHVAGRFLVALAVLGWLTWMALSKRRKKALAGGGETQFPSQPYAHLAKVLRERGNDDAAREVEAEKMWQEAVVRSRTSQAHWLTKHLWWRPYRVMFNFGLSTTRALVSMMVVWLLGWSVVFLLSRAGMLRESVARVAPAVLMEKGRPPRAAVDSVYTEEATGLEANYSCGEGIEPALYAFELMTPVVNLHQEARCGIRSKLKASDGTVPRMSVGAGRFRVPLPLILSFGWFWEYAKGVYILVGSVVTSLALLTFSGIARRWEH
jgi:hypothetical protein